MILRRLVPGCNALFRHPLAGGLSVFQRGFKANLKRVEVIVIKDMPGYASRLDVINVKPGFARNWLIPQQLAVYAIPENREFYGLPPKPRKDEAVVVTAGSRDIEVKRFLQQLVFRIQKITLRFARTAVDGQLQDPVTAADIADKLFKYHFFTGLTPESIVMPEGAATTVGEHVVKVRMDKGWVLPGLGLFGEFEKLADQPANIKIKLEAKKVLTEAEKKEKAERRQLDKEARQAEKAEEAEKKEPEKPRAASGKAGGKEPKKAKSKGK